MVYIKVKESQSQKVARGEEMAKLSDLIEDFIQRLIDVEGTQIVIQRNELANKFNCAPSQINYVLSTRFTLERGYQIESRRGGGGYITIFRVKNTNHQLKELLLTKISNSITFNNALNIIKNLLDKGYISEREYIIIKTTICDRSLSANALDKNALRANLLKNILFVILNLGDD